MRTSKRYPPLALICVDAALAVWAIPQARPDAEGRTVGHIRRIKRKSIVSYGYEVSEEAGTSIDLFPTPYAAAMEMLSLLGGHAAVKAESLIVPPAAAAA